MINVETAGVDVERPRARTRPNSQEFQTFGGCGSGRVCAMCGAVIPTNRMEIKVEYGPESGTDSLALHVMCFSAWLETAGAGEL